MLTKYMLRVSNLMVTTKAIKRAKLQQTNTCYYAPAPRVGGIKRVWRLSVWRLSVTYIEPKSRTERPRKTKIGTEVAHITRDSDTTFTVKRSKVNLQGAYCGSLPHSLFYRPDALPVTQPTVLKDWKEMVDGRYWTIYLIPRSAAVQTRIYMYLAARAQGVKFWFSRAHH